MARKPISKATRFEVFKRDKFTCQYCGASAPEVLLEVDHIKPVAKGGTNDMLNLVTACRACNRGKTCKELSDNTTVKVQKQQLDDMQERREQLEMMLKWREALDEEIAIEVDSIAVLFSNETGYALTDNGKRAVKQLIKRFSFNEVYEAAEISLARYFRGHANSVEIALNKIGGVCYNRRKAMKEDAEQNS